MPTFREFKTNFTAGEFSPRLEGRTDISRYANAAKTVLNYIVQPHGGVRRRPGTKFVAEVKTSSKKTRLVSFEFSTTQAYMLEFGDLYIRFYKDSGQIQSGGAAVEVVSPYVEADLFDLKFAQSADTLYIVHQRYAPRKLTRTSHTAWTLTTISFTDGPYLAEKTDITFTPSAVTGNGITLTASAAFFDTSSPSKHIDALLRLKHSLKPGTPTVTPQGTTGTTAYGYSIAALDAAGETLQSTVGTTTTGNATLDATNFNRVTWTSVPGAKAYRVYGRKANAQLFVAETTATTFDDMASVTPAGAPAKKDTTDTWGYAKITAVASGTSATADAKVAFGATTASTAYREGAWSTKQGFPRSISFYEERLVFAGPTENPQRLDGSVSGVYEELTPGVKDDDPISFVVASGQMNAIQWLEAGRWLMMGTSGGEFRAGATDEDPVSPTNFNTKPETSWGSAAISPARIGGAVLFVQRGKRKIREFTFILEANAFVAPDLTILSEHFFGPGKTVSQIAFQSEPDPILWVVRSDGLLAGMTYDRTQDVVGWHRHITGPLQDLTDGKFESVSIIPHPDGDRDQVWFVVNRLVNGATRRYVEFFEDKGVFYEDQHVDSGLTYSGAAVLTVSGLSHLNGESVRVVGDGAVYDNVTVSAGIVTLAPAVSAAKIEVGLKYDSKLELLRPDVQAAGGTTQALVKRVVEVAVRLYKTLGATINGEVIPFRSAGDLMDTPPPLLTGLERTINLGFDRDALITIEQTQALPSAIISVTSTIEVGER